MQKLVSIAFNIDETGEAGRVMDSILEPIGYRPTQMYISSRLLTTIGYIVRCDGTLPPVAGIPQLSTRIDVRDERPSPKPGVVQKADQAGRAG